MVYTEKELIDFGNYLLSEYRGTLIAEGAILANADVEGELRQVHGADIANWYRGPREQPLSYGEKMVGMEFNPSGANSVLQIKRHCAGLIDAMDKLRSETEDPNVKFIATHAIGDVIAAQMMAVKAVTWRT